MGTKKSGDTAVATAFVLKVSMHCHCRGCVDRIRSAVRDLTLVHGVEAVDQSAVETAGEVRMVATADPEKLRRRLRKATRKHVDLLLLPKPEAPAAAAKKETAARPPEDRRRRVVDQLLPPQYGGWVPNHQQQVPGGGWNNGSLYGAAAAAAAAAYPWAAGAAAWGPYAYPPPPAQAHGGAYYGVAPAWQGY